MYIYTRSPILNSYKYMKLHHIYIYTSARDVMGIVVGNGHDETSSNSEPG